MRPDLSNSVDGVKQIVLIILILLFRHNECLISFLLINCHLTNAIKFQKITYAKQYV